MDLGSFTGPLPKMPRGCEDMWLANKAWPSTSKSYSR
jgi:hypothetical protein